MGLGNVEGGEIFDVNGGSGGIGWMVVVLEGKLVIV